MEKVRTFRRNKDYGFRTLDGVVPFGMERVTADVEAVDFRFGTLMRLGPRVGLHSTLKPVRGRYGQLHPAPGSFWAVDPANSERCCRTGDELLVEEPSAKVGASRLL